MNRLTKISTLLLVALCALSACDRDKPTSPEEARQKQKNAEAEAWLGLQQTLENEPDGLARLDALEKFIAAHPEHPDVATAKKKHEELKRELEAKKKFDEVKAKAVDEGDPLSVALLFASEFARTLGDRYKTGALSEPADVPTSEGLAEFEQSAMLRPTRVRSYARLVLKEHAPDLVEERCFVECQNAAVNSIFAKSAGKVFLEPGKMNPDAVGPILEKLWVAPDQKLMGVSSKNFYRAFRATPRAYKRVAMVLEEIGTDEAVEEFQKLEGRAVTTFYRTFARENEVSERAKVSKYDAPALVGWWLRRQADGTAKLFDDYLTKTLEAYDDPDNWKP